MIESAILHHVKQNRGVVIGPLADYSVTPSELEAYLLDRSDWDPLSTPTGLKGRKGKTVLPTFDDGYRNNLTNALPILEKHGFSCLLFITTGFIDGAVYPYELELAEVVEHADTLSIPGKTEPTELYAPSGRQSLYRELRFPLKPASQSEREGFMNRLARLNGYDRTDMQKESLLNWDEVRELSKHPLVTIGAHTLSHVLLPQQTWQTAWKEIRNSKEQLEKRIGTPVDYFSYPYGGNSIAVRQMVRWAGFKYGFTTQMGRVDRVTAWNRYALPRIDISDLLPDDE